MPVVIDHIDTEIEMAPRAKAAHGEPAPAPAPPAAVLTAEDIDRRVLAVLERELDTYLRMRG